MSAPYEFPANSDLSSVGIYNVLDQSYNGGMTTTDMVGTQNQGALQAAVNAALAASGGLVFIPAGVYKIAGTITIDPTNNVGVIIAGSSGGTALVQQNAVTTFSLQYTGGSNTAGVRFEDLLIQYKSGLTSGTAISVSNFQNVGCERVFFSDCPQAVLYDNRSLQCGLLDCTIDYENGAAGATMVSISGAEDYIHNCVIRQKPQGDSPPGPADCVGIEILSASGVYVTNSHVSEFNIGINIQGGGVNPLLAHFTNVVSQSWRNSVYIQPATSGGLIYQVFFDNCVFAKANDSTVTDAGVYIDTNGGANSTVSDILFSNCMCYHWGGPGMKINSGQNIQIIGGRYGSCALATTMTTSGGIAITGAAANVSIEGVDCSGTVPGYQQQPYGISITAAVAGGYIRGCNFTGNKNGSIYLNSAGTQLEITECAGYNDQNTPLNGSHAPTSATSAETSSTPYFGPSTVAFSNATALTVHISGTPYMMSFGSIYLPRPNDQIYFSPIAPTTFTWLGK